MTRPFHDIVPRALLAIGGSVAAALLIIFGPTAAVAGAVAVVAVISLRESSRMAGSPSGATVGAEAALPSLLCLLWPDARSVIGWGGIAGATFLIVLLVARRADAGLSRLPRYIHASVLPAALVILHTSGPAGPRLAVFALLVAWSSDVGAYVSGRVLGGPRLAPRLSPRKTVAGAVGGLVLPVAVAHLTGLWTPLGWSALQRTGVALVTAAAAQAGDLYESGVKRAADREHSGTLFRSEGGMLDVMDSVSFAAPALYLLAAVLP